MRTMKSRARDVATRRPLPPVLLTFLDGLDALCDGRGWGREHQEAMDRLLEILKTRGEDT